MKRFTMFFVAVFALCTLVACQGGTITVDSISIQGQDTELNVGEKFSTGALAVTAHYSDDSTADVTDKAEIIQNVNMNQAGAYLVVVLYEGANATYEVKVVAPEATLVAIDVNAENAKIEYAVGEELSTEGLVVYETYSDGSIIKVTDLAAYEVEVEGAFEALGKYTVTVAKGELTDTYEVAVEPKEYATVAEAIEAAIANADKANGGVALIEQYDQLTISEYEFGKNYTHVQDGSYDYYYELLEDGTVFGVDVYYSEYEGEMLSKSWGVTSEYLKGINFGDMLNSSYEIFGFEALVETLYYVGAEEGLAFNYVENADAKYGNPYAYAFSYEVVLSDSYYYFVEVGFDLDKLTGCISSVSVEMNCYYTWNLEQNLETGEYILPEGQPFDFSRKAEARQTVGERTAENPHGAEKYLYQSFELVDANGDKIEAGEEITIKAKNYAYLDIQGVLPETANSSIDTFEFTKVDSEGYETWNVSASVEDGQVKLYSGKVGTYTITVKTALVELSFVLNVEYAELTDFSAAANNEYYELEAITAAQVYAGSAFDFSVLTNDGANPAATAALKEENENATVTETYDGFSFNATVPGTYVVVLTSTVDESFTAEVEITVLEAPKMSDILNGKYVNTWETITVVFTPESEGAVKGTITYSEQRYWADPIEYTGTYEYFADLQILQVNLPKCQYTFVINSEFGIDLQSDGWTQDVLTKVVETSGEEYTGYWTHPRLGFNYEMSITFGEGASGTYSFMDGQYEGEFTYIESEGVYYISVAENFSVTAIEATLENGVLTVIATIDGGTCEFEAAK